MSGESWNSRNNETISDILLSSQESFQIKRKLPKKKAPQKKINTRYLSTRKPRNIQKENLEAPPKFQKFEEFYNKMAKELEDSISIDISVDLSP